VPFSLPAAFHTALAKSQKYTGWSFVMIKASPSTFSWSKGAVESEEVERSA